MAFREHEADAAGGEVGIAAAVESIWVIAVASSTSQRVSAGIASAIATSRAWMWSALKKSRSPSISAMVSPGTGRASARRCSL